jgi:HSP20 family molecular chaperone IbpA
LALEWQGNDACGDWHVSVHISEIDGDCRVKTEFAGLKKEAVWGILQKGMFIVQGEQKEE